MPSILRPKAVRTGDLVAVAALSGGLEEGEASLFERGVEAIEQMGFAVHVSPVVDLDRRWWWAAASPPEPGVLPPGRRWECWRSGRARGPLVGGMLNRLVRVQSTSYALTPEHFDGAILFWEEAFTSTAVVWNDLHVLRHAGVLDRIAGMVVGAPFEVEPTEGGPDTLREIVLEVVGERDIPVLGNVDVGHDPPSLPMPLGIRAEMDADALTLSLLEPAVIAG